jgi:chemotaxis protein MotA
MNEQSIQRQFITRAFWRLAIVLVGWLLTWGTVSLINWNGEQFGKTYIHSHVRWNVSGLPAVLDQLKDPGQKAGVSDAKGLEPAKVERDVKDGNVGSDANPGAEATKPISLLSEAQREKSRRKTTGDAILSWRKDLWPGESETDKAANMAFEKEFFLPPYSGAPPRWNATKFDEFFHRYGGMRAVMVIPTETSIRKSLLEGIRANHPKEEKRLETQKAEIEQHFLMFYGTLLQETPLKMVRWCNGWVQYLTFWAFWVAMILVVRNYVRNSLTEDLRRAAAGRLVPHGSHGDIGLGESQIRRLHYDLGRQPKSFARTLTRTVLASYLSGQLRAWNMPSDREKSPCHDLVDKLVQNRLKELDSNQAPIIYLAWSMPSLGFIGTVLGIGSALMSADRMMTTDTELQKTAIQSIVLDLGMAFDTTLVALLLSLVLMAFIYLGRRSEERIPLRLQSEIMDTVVSRLN